MSFLIIKTFSDIMLNLAIIWKLRLAPFLAGSHLLCHSNCQIVQPLFKKILHIHQFLELGNPRPLVVFSQVRIWSE